VAQSCRQLGSTAGITSASLNLRTGLAQFLSFIGTSARLGVGQEKPASYPVWSNFSDKGSLEGHFEVLTKEFAEFADSLWDFEGFDDGGACKTIEDLGRELGVRP
jgi:hypothetical protein